MADKDLGDGPSLELPKLFGRTKKDRKRRDDGPARTPEGTPETAREPDPAEQTMPLPVLESVPEPARETAPVTPEPPAPAPAPVGAAAPAPAPTVVDTRVDTVPEAAVVEPKERRLPRGPVMPTLAAAVLVGALVAAVGIGLTWLGLLGCEALRGTESCGGPGLLVMLAIMVAMVLIGAALLKALGVPQSGSLSFLGFGILAVVVLMFLLEDLYEPWVLVALPVISAAGYGIAHWVTTRFTEPDPDFTH